MVKREAPTSYPVMGEDKAMLRHHSLLQDYQDLVKETEAQRQGLLKANQNKLKLLAEVRFLRRKLKSFSEKPSFKNRHRAKNQACKPPSARYARIPNYVLPTKAHLVDRNYKTKEDAVPASTILLDLNQDAEELEWDPPRTQSLSLKKCPVDNGALDNDLKLSLCRDTGNEVNQAGRRKISWQDQLPLRV